MKMYYLNDETVPVTIQVVSQCRPHPNNPYGEPSIEYFRLKPCEGRIFEVDAPESSILYVKRWDNHTVLLSYIGMEAVGHIGNIDKP